MTSSASREPQRGAARQYEGRIATAVAEYLRREGERFGLAPEAVEVQFVYNPGGFTNWSFTVGDGRVAVHVKLSEAPDRVERLRRWYVLHAALEQRYHAPPVLGWIDLELPGAPAVAAVRGLILSHLPGRSLDLTRPDDGALLDEIVPVIDQLHRDRAPAARLGAVRPREITCRDSFAETYLDRFREELDALALVRPLFVSAELVDWMRRETDTLGALAAGTAFAAAADAPIHGDLNANNVLVEADPVLPEREGRITRGTIGGR